MVMIKSCLLTLQTVLIKKSNVYGIKNKQYFL